MLRQLLLHELYNFLCGFVRILFLNKEKVALLPIRDVEYIIP